MNFKKLSCKVMVLAATLAMVLTMLPVRTPDVWAMAASEFIVGDTSGTADIKTVTVGGSATDHGYKITDAAGLKHFAECVNSGVSFKGKTITLAGDIDLNPGVTLLDEDHEPVSGLKLSNLYQFPGIGTEEYPFDGIFNGNGYVIKGLYMNSETNACDETTALFNVVNCATIKNVGIYDSYIRLESGYGAGLLADTGYSLGWNGSGKPETTTVTNCFFIGQVDATDNNENWVGGLIGFFGHTKGTDATITDCYADAVVKSASVKRVGMIVGQNYGSIGNCYVTGGKVDVAGSSDMGTVEGRKGEGHLATSYTVNGLLYIGGAVQEESSGSNLEVFDTADEVKAMVPNQCFLSVLNGTYVIGKGIPQGDGTYSNNYTINVNIPGSEPDEPQEPTLPAAAKDNGYDYSWSVDEDGMQGLPDIITDGSATNVTDELVDALYEAIHTEGFFKPAKNVILMIGDGMGINPVTASEHWYGELIMNDLPNQAAAMTRSYTSEFSDTFTDSFEDNVKVSTALRITDSSAGGSAIASGYKTYYYGLAVGMDGSDLKSLADVKDERGGAVGIVTNGWISDATPLVFLGHSIMRGAEDEELAAYGQENIQTQMFDYAPELLIGQASKYETISKEFSKSGNASFIEENDMGIAYSWSDYLNLDTEHNVLTTTVAFDYDISASDAATNPNMVQVTAQALQQLDAQGGDEGFFIMIEDGEIDADGHNNERDNQLQEIQNFDEAVAVAVKYVLEHPDTILVVTADHDTGGMVLMDGWDEYKKKASYTTGGHSVNNVPVYAIGYGTEIFNGQVYQNNYTGRILGNLMGDTGFGDSEKDPMVILDGGKYGNNLIAALVDTGKAVGSYSDATYTYNILTTAERDAEIEAATTVYFVAPTLDTTVNEAVVVKTGDTLDEPEALVSKVEGYEFTGWYKNKACTIPWDFDTDVVASSGDTVLYAGWQVNSDAPEVIPTPNPGSNDVTSFVTRLYNVVLDREPDAGGLEEWVDKLNDGRKNGVEVAEEFFLSKEFLAKEMTDEEFVETLYLAYFDREADAGGKASWLNVLEEGYVKDYVIKRFAESEEYQEICEEYGIEYGEVDLSLSVRMPHEDYREYLVWSFVERYYQEFMGREADLDGLRSWAGKLLDGTHTGVEVAEGFFESPEFQSKTLTNEEYISVLYRVFFNRTAEETGLEFWVGLLDEGYVKKYVMRGFCESKEFTKLCNSYDIARGDLKLSMSEECAHESEQALNVSKFVEGFYQTVLNRRPDAEGLLSWTKQLLTGTTTGAAMAEFFIFGEELTAQDPSDEEFIKIMYQTFLGRDAEDDPAGFDFWLERMAGGETREWVFDGFVASEEFSKLCEKYGIIKGDIGGGSDEPEVTYINMGYLPYYRTSYYEDLDYDALTHLCLAFFNPDASSVEITHRFDSDDEVVDIIDLAHDNDVLVLASYGGASGKDAYIDLLPSSSKREKLVENMVEHAVENGFDGIDIDIEASSSSPEIWNYYDSFISALRKRCDEEGLLLTTATAKWIAKNTSSSALKMFDLVGVMAYDNSGANHSTYEDAIAAVKYFEGRGIPKSKIIMGVPFYGYIANTNLEGAATYKSICEKDSGAYMKDLSNGIAYNGIPTIQKKCQYVMDNGYAGMLIWEVGQDSTVEKYSLLRAMKLTLYGEAGVR